MIKIMVVDDDSDIVSSVQTILEANGYAVETAFSKEEAEKLLPEFQPDLLIQDVIMTNLDDGIVFVQELRKSGFDKPIIMFSSINEITAFKYAVDDEMIPANVFLDKPVKVDALLKTINELLKK